MAALHAQHRVVSLRRGSLPIRFVDREIFVPRRTKSIDDPRLLEGLHAVRDIACKVERIARLHIVGGSIDNQLHSSGQNVDDLFVWMLVRRHLAAGFEAR